MGYGEGIHLYKSRYVKRSGDLSWSPDTFPGEQCLTWDLLYEEKAWRSSKCIKINTWRCLHYTKKKEVRVSRALGIRNGMRCSQTPAKVSVPMSWECPRPRGSTGFRVTLCITVSHLLFKFLAVFITMEVKIKTAGPDWNCVSGSIPDPALHLIPASACWLFNLSQAFYK